MFLYFIVLVLILVLRASLPQGNLWHDKQEEKFCRIVFFVLILLASLRYVIYDSDAYRYILYYYDLRDMSFRNVIDLWPSYWVFFSLSKIISYFRVPYQIWFATIEFFYLTGIARLLKKFSDDKLLGIFLFFTIGLFGFSFNALKQVVAMAFVWHAFISFYERKYVVAVFLSLLAYYTHPTSAVFILSFALLFIRNEKLIVFLVASLVLGLVFAPEYILSFIAEESGDEHFMSYLDVDYQYSYATFIIYIILFGISLYSITRHKIKFTNSTLILSFAAIATFGQLLGVMVSHMFRLSLYYSPFLIIGITNCIKKKDIQYIVIIIMTIWLLYTSRQIPYKFFWQ